MTLINYHVALTVLLVVACAAMTAWVFWPSRRPHYQDIARRILQDQPAEEKKDDE